MSDLPDIFLDDAARVAAIAMTPEQRKKLLHTLRSLQRDSEIGLPYTAGDDLSGRIIVVPGDDAVPGMTLSYRIGEEQIRVVNILVGP
ncbi:hypothetical protein OG455_41425 [Kitasatospora sp. NBC_01287]|uniref:hypothetical protein n=1 Tax=Kitasatospora sp. NBC_01287 TaxID=2903573 RepID=UPI002250DF03|nr:hypothetical protein [Kitasatospora sp. NBC_01287]MCX4750945.1 hypothetical protein [Kitasatospora sp. NBC_01287]MCX4751804.1 hypothetical protein [Kitasatospora sp. NBC_01287]MCX4751904.1 hypothetical protein [Kitasatospora sp. NBC_01287]